VSPVDELLVVVAALYLYESAVAVPRGAVAFTSWLGDSFRIRESTGFLGNERFGVLIAPLLPPLGSVHVVGGSATAPAALAAALDVGAVKRDEARFHAESRALRLLCNALFLWFFALLPWVGHREGLTSRWVELLLSLVLLVGAIVVRFLLAHRRLHPDRAAERRRLILPLALAPLEAVRAVDHLGKRLHASRHPVAVALALAPAETARAFAGRALLAALHPLPPQPRDEALAAAISAALAGNGIDVAALLREPTPDSAASVAWCPRCRAQYERAASSCGDCPGVALVAFAAQG
jgi:hypothetical protein